MGFTPPISKTRKATPMSFFTRPVVLPAPFVRSVAIAALLGTTMLVAPLTAVWAQTSAAQTAAATGATETKGETVEQRITALHTALKITANEEASWNSVAQAMRENAAAMDKLVASKRTTPRRR